MEGSHPYSQADHEVSDHIPLFLVPAPAGSASPADDHVDQLISASELCIPKKSISFACRVRGDSMVGEGIESGDTVVVERSETAQPGDIVVATVDAELTIKQFEQVGEKVYLYPANSKYDAIQIREGMTLIIWGIVRRIIKAV